MWLVLLAGCGWIAVTASGIGSGSPHVSGSPAAATALPAAARGPVSAALGRGDARYRLAGLGGRNPAQRLAARFGRTGVVVRSGGAQFAIGLGGFGRGGALRALPPVRPRASGPNGVRYAHPGVSEWWVNGPLGLEQGFDVASRPAGSGALTFSIRVPAGARIDHGAVVLPGGLRYGGLRASDATGRALPVWLSLRAGHALLRVDDRGARYPLRVDPFIQQAKLTASNGAANDGFGGSVAVSGDTLVVGAPEANGTKGAVYVFSKPASGWANATQIATLTETGGASGDVLGWSVSVSGDTIVAGEPGRNTNHGAAYVYVKPSDGWVDATQTARLTADDGAANEYLGLSVAVSGDTVVAGAPQHKVGANVNQGAAYVYTMPVGGWVTMSQTAELTAGNGAASDVLGWSVAVSGDTIVAGAPIHLVGANAGQGEAYVYTKPANGGWLDATAIARLTASDGRGGDSFGGSVAVSGDTIVAGAIDHKVGSNDAQGAAYVYMRPSTGPWATATETARLTAADGSASDTFGFSVAVSGDTIVAGAPLHKVGANVNQGAAYVYTLPAGGWVTGTQQSELTASSGASDDFLGGVDSVLPGGSALAVSGATVVAGASGSNNFQGAAYVFGPPPPSVAIASPVIGATYSQGQVVAAAYACSQALAATIASCTGPVPNGAAIDTAALGPHSFTVTATNDDGRNSAQTVSYSVAVPPDRTPPTLSSAKLTHPSFAVSSSSTATTASRRARRKPPRGTVIKFGLSETATVTLTFTHNTAGRKHGHSCKPTTKPVAKKLRCTATVMDGVLTRASEPAGSDRVPFSGRIGHRALEPGRYTLRIDATDPAGNKATPKTLHLIIVSG